MEMFGVRSLIHTVLKNEEGLQDEKQPFREVVCI
jgi:hypothetical protein